MHYVAAVVVVAVGGTQKSLSMTVTIGYQYWRKLVYLLISKIPTPLVQNLDVDRLMESFTPTRFIQASFVGSLYQTSPFN